ncbi:MAG: hypothetical protein ACREIT_05440 [Tepidisphaeraceae bacterium]
MSDTLPGKGLMGWLGRQVGYVKRAVRTEAQQPPPPKKLYENKTVAEARHPENPKVVLRRTVIDEAIEETKRSEPRMKTDEHR